MLKKGNSRTNLKVHKNNLKQRLTRELAVPKQSEEKGNWLKSKNSLKKQSNRFRGRKSLLSRNRNLPKNKPVVIGSIKLLNSSHNLTQKILLLTLIESRKHLPCQKPHHLLNLQRQTILIPGSILLLLSSIMTHSNSQRRHMSKQRKHKLR